ncbi:VOC family protein [Streptomyces zingiberis]|uniref:Glyoxalase n=1 Tax=Streptomyces zingiberis TaxID=2053010 RepID=A0ABX1C545_9ACTN|nr:VOC family protein [Streptomyces zingiberis]NJQ03740.1 glyoxalase [Streptomyces zingiberis]
MRNPADACHIAVPARDLDAAAHFYNTLLGCPLARRRDDRVTFDFFGDQLVCHHAPDEPAVDRPHLYPRHFGVTFRSRADFDALLRLVALREVPVFRETTTRFAGTAEEHSTLVLTDPSGNLLEFKHYTDARMMY